MTLTLSSWFGEVGIKFKISFKVHKLIRELLIENVMKPFGLDSKDPEVFLGLVLTTTKETRDLEVRGPEYDRKNKYINYGLWLPYEKIDNSNNYLQEYLNYYFDALVILFNKYNISEESILKVKYKVEEEVLNNANYSYSE